MKGLKAKVVITLGLVLLSIFLGSCDTTPKYTVWTRSTDYSDSYDIEDGFHRYGEYTDEEFMKTAELRSFMEKHSWTEDLIYSWFIGHGFDDQRAKEKVAWRITTKHCSVFARNGNRLDIIIK